MRKRSAAVQLDEMVQAMLVSLKPRPEEDASSSVAPLVAVAHALRDLPREEFRTNLKSRLQRRILMTEGTGTSLTPARHFIPPGFTSITPYILVRGGAQFIEFLKSAFAGEERLRVPTAEGAIMHAEVAIGNGMIEVGD